MAKATTEKVTTVTVNLELTQDEAHTLYSIMKDATEGFVIYAALLEVLEDL